MKFNGCKLSDYDINAKEGDVITFIMPGFCSGDYTYTVTKDEVHGLVLIDAPSKIFEGCYDYKINPQ